MVIPPCFKCASTKIGFKRDRVFRIGIPWLQSLAQIEGRVVCEECGATVRNFRDLASTQSWVREAPAIHDGPDSGLEQKYVMHDYLDDPNDYLIGVSYPAVTDRADTVLHPTFEGNIQDATVIDRNGDAELMTDFAEEYLRQFWTLLPEGRLPQSLKEIMPGLLLLYSAAEQAIKAFLIRDGKGQGSNHDLPGLYERIGKRDKLEVENRFTGSDINRPLNELGVPIPKASDILAAYSHTYGKSSVHMDSRYYPEPTTMFKDQSLKGRQVLKAETPYPIFLPYLVQAMIDAYRMQSHP